MSRFEDVLESKRSSAVRAVLRLCDAYLAPSSQMTLESFLQAAVSVIGGAREQAKVLALALLAEYIEEETKQPYVFPQPVLAASLAVVGVEGSTSPLAMLGLYKALSAILRDFDSETGSEYLEGSQSLGDSLTEPSSTAQDTLRMKLERLVTNDFYFTAQETTHQAIQGISEGEQGAKRSEPVIIGWTREMEATACQLCRWWDRNGRVWPVTKRMPTHKGCACSQKPVIKATKD